MTPFKMTITLATPVVLPFSTTLDGLLSFAGETLTGKRDDELMEAMPLALDADSRVFRASSIFLERDASHEHLIKVRAFRHLDLDKAMIGPNRTKSGKPARNPYPQIDKSRGAYANKLTMMHTLRTPRAVCYGVGDTDMIRTYMHCIQGLGRHAQSGAGEIHRVEIHPISDDLSWVSQEGEPQRPIPVKAWEESGGSLDNVATSMVAARFPYWGEPLERCVVPRRTMISL